MFVVGAAKKVFSAPAPEVVLINEAELSDNKVISEKRFEIKTILSLLPSSRWIFSQKKSYELLKIVLSARTFYQKGDDILFK